jgi:hypothetical protein
VRVSVDPKPTIAAVRFEVLHVLAARQRAINSYRERNAPFWMAGATYEAPSLFQVSRM